MSCTKVELARVYENTSARSGKTYFVGYLGRSKLLMLKNERAAEGEPAWTIFLVERPEKRAASGEQAQPNPQGYRNGGPPAKPAVDEPAW